MCGVSWAEAAVEIHGDDESVADDERNGGLFGVK